jgi:hypothetical protein
MRGLAEYPSTTSGFSFLVMRTLRTPAQPVQPALVLSIPALVLGLVLSGPVPTAAQDAPVALLSRQGELRVMAGDGLHASRIADDALFAAVAPLDRDRWVAAGVRGGSNLLLVRGEGDAAERIAVPAVGGSVAMFPVPLTRDGDLVGLAWLSGDDPHRLSVRYARWEGGSAIGSWGETETVAGPPARGSQLALSGAVLRDGSIMLVWSRFDGRDDEIVWSRLDGRRWSAPARVAGDNRVPDVTPSVAPLGDGAIVAWSRFGQDAYHVATARWPGSGGRRGEGWTAAEPTGPRGSGRPHLRAEGDGALLLYRDVLREGYGVLRIDPAGTVTGRAFLPHASAEGVPAIAGADEVSVRVVPPGASAARSLSWHR